MTSQLQIDEKSYCPKEQWKTILVRGFEKEKYEIKFQYFIDLIDVKKEINRQTREDLPLDHILLHKSSRGVCRQCRKDHTFLKDEELFMIVRS